MLAAQTANADIIANANNPAGDIDPPIVLQRVPGLAEGGTTGTVTFAGPQRVTGLLPHRDWHWVGARQAPQYRERYLGVARALHV